MTYRIHRQLVDHADFERAVEKFKTEREEFDSEKEEFKRERDNKKRYASDGSNRIIPETQQKFIFLSLVD
ncbi:hypothetical protein QJS10_CPB21g00474 [Acorus calamus]|uniref:Uncharacterized protein n=1 Tax=Acorus calamus TaxID=4465 RepID=A0AAV9C767_ACOCL|nr:hypothetical protein QJS10_CPB21g00474 [Acorus calamus]